ncbi:Corticotropin-releasing factor receptor 2 [Clonorchis sinensis]|uniref:Corticotropin-releasing factor receptor 2 n=1 Tax=Clonorchis sinensis TaxID=79923 RepID=A0A8T1LXJ5_CLOSI|nr:Corticotropin-releasing factor receptor 2 [Clonorchis sinensis]
MLSILIRAIVWLGSAVVVVYYPEMDRLGNLLVIFRVFILVAVYSWMLVEGIYLFSLLFWTLTAQHFRFYGFFAIGWGIPGVLSIGYAITKLSKKGCPKWDDPTLYEPEGTAVLGSILCMLAINLIITTITIYTLLTNVQRRSTGCRHAGGSAASRSGSNRLIGEVVFNYVRAPKRFGSTANQTRSKESCLVNKTGTEDDTQSEERFNRVSGADWSSDDRAARSTLSSGTVQPRHELLEFLKKHGLRSSSKTPRSKTWKNNSLEPWKALKAILVLMPILGYPQLIFLRPYFQNFEMVFEYINAIIIGTQGFWVSVIYCFWNSEVQRLMGLRWRQWKRNSRMSKHLQAHKKLSQSQPGEDKLATTTPSATPNKCEVLCTAE